MSVSFWQLLRPSRHNSTAAGANPHPLGIAPSASRLLGRIQLLYDHIASPRFLMFQSVPSWRRFPAYTIDQGVQQLMPILQTCAVTVSGPAYTGFWLQREKEMNFMFPFFIIHIHFAAAGRAMKGIMCMLSWRKAGRGSRAEWGAGGGRRCELWGRVDGGAGGAFVEEECSFLSLRWCLRWFYFNWLRVLFQPLFRLLFLLHIRHPVCSAGNSDKVTLLFLYSTKDNMTVTKERGKQKRSSWKWEW